MNEFQTKSTHIFHYVLIFKDHAKLFTKSSYSSIDFCKNSKMKKNSFFFLSLSNFLSPTITVHYFSFNLIIYMLEKIPITLPYVQIILQSVKILQTCSFLWLGFLMAWWLQWSLTYSQKLRAPRTCVLENKMTVISFYDLALEVRKYHFSNILLIKAVTSLSILKERWQRLSLTGALNILQPCFFKTTTIVLMMSI